MGNYTYINIIYMLASPSLRSEARRSGLTDLPRPNIRGLPTAQPERRSGDRAKNRGRTIIIPASTNVNNC
jgi:hypothetical protein